MKRFLSSMIGVLLFSTLAFSQSQGQGDDSPGKLGILFYGISTNSAPSYGNNKLNTLSLDAAGSLRVNCITGCGGGGGGGVVTIMGITPGQATMANSLPVVVASDQTPVGQTTMSASAPVVIASDQSAFSIKLSDGTHTIVVDPCQDASLTKTNFNVRVASASLTQLIPAQALKTTYICWLKIETDGTTETASVVEAAHTTTACDGTLNALEGNTTAANGIAIGANNGFRVGDGGFWVYQTLAVNHEVCGFDVGTNPVHYSGQWVAR